MTKQELRNKYKLLRTNLSQTEVEEFSSAIANQLLKLGIWDKVHYHIFMPIKEHNEV
ncbi:MAG: 5-formyltetrahydrofolate cyclo-ligase, partial [Flavobacterium sp.]|nr:5-formyltetrahydrofolate cyclo-ligase [Flavobacterium sp.]